MESSAPAQPRRRSILVTGDVVVDHQIYLGQQQRPGSTLRLGTVAMEAAGGVALLRDLQQAVAANSLEAASDDIILGVKTPTECKLPPSLHGYGVFKPFPVRDGDTQSPPVWRLGEALGFGGEPMEQFQPIADCQALVRDYDVIVIDDAGLGYRVQTAKDAWPRAFREKEAKWPDWIVIKLSAPVGCGDLWRALRTNSREGERLGDRSVVIVSINDLRAEGAQVSKALSWERSALDLSAELVHNPRLRDLSVCRYVIVSFQTDGALLADFSIEAKPVFRLLFDAAHLEGDWAESIPGAMYGLQTCLAAAVVDNLPDRSAASDIARGALERGMATGLAGMRRLIMNGHGTAQVMATGFPFSAVAAEFRKQKRDWDYAATSVPDLDSAACLRWTILEGEDSANGCRNPLSGTARRVAMRGPSELRHVPYQRFGGLFVIERNEIESLRSLRRLVRDYQSDRAATKPLSIAVFGPPGAGKSYGVKQVARSVLGSKTPILEFNLAQYANAGELVGLFHQVRDKVLEGHLPVVFWDEFDSQGLMWLQFLLAPMQDGVFQHGQMSHPIGKCVFVFAGGTSYDVQSFGPSEPSAQGTPSERERWKDFKDQKGPDFMSRLSGYLNVLGPNQRQVWEPQIATWQNDPTDVSFPIRRALFARAKLTKSDSERLAIDKDVLTALLEVGRYKHGSRSLEKILEQLRQSSRTGSIERSDVPPAHLLALHANEIEFLQLIDRSQKFPGNVEAMAKAYHEYYRQKFPGGSYDMPYTELGEDLKDDNRAAARRIPDVLSLAGLYLYLKKDESEVSATEDDGIMAILERNLEILAEAEHDGWMEYKLRQGWRLVADKSQRNDSLRLHHLLVAYRDLPSFPKDERDKDRDAVRRYPDIVARQGYRIVAEPPPDLM